MRTPDARTLTAQGQIQLKFTKRKGKPVCTLQCLIVSVDGARREQFERSAGEGGWQALSCADVETALAHAKRSLVQLAIVDLEHQPPRAFRPVIEQLAAAASLLLIVCGNEGDIEEEIWVRQIGAWLYLPVVDSSNFTLLCGEAREIAQRLSRPSGRERVTDFSTAASGQSPKV